MRGPAAQLLLIGILLTSVLVTGTAGFYSLEGWGLFDSFYMALTTLTTVGYKEVHPLSETGRVFNSLLIMSGVTVVFVSIGLLADVVLKLELANYFGRRRMQRKVEKISNHYIVCGLGRVGRGVVSELRRGGALVLVVDNSAERAKWAIDQDIPTLIDDATRDDALKRAHIETARGLVAAIASDADNVYVALSARVLNPKLLISARASDEQAEEKLRRAGASTVFTPYEFIGHRLAQSMLRPHVLSFLDIASAFRGSDLDLEMEQIRVSGRSHVAAKTLEQSRVRQAFGVIVLAVIKPDGAMKFNPAGDTLIEAGDVLIAMGERSRLSEMEATLEA